MSFEAEFRLPGSKPYEYINIVVRGNDEREFDQDLNAINAELVTKLKDIHRLAADIVAARQAAAPVVNPQRTTVVSATDLITSELGGTVVSETITDVKPWERPKPATSSVNLF